MSNDLVVGSGRGVFRPGQLTGLAAKRAALKANMLATTGELPASEAEHRIGIIFDESGSMMPKQLQMAKDGVEEFLRSCEPNKTAVAVYTLSNFSDNIELSKQLPAVALMVKNITSGSTT